MKTAASDTMAALLPVLDDFDRAKKNAENEQTEEVFSEGVNLVYTKLYNVLKQKGLIPMEADGKDFDADHRQNIEFLLKAISSEGVLTVPFSPNDVQATGRGSGVVLGGNLSLLCHLIGTPYFPLMDDTLLFIEETGEPLYRLDRMLTHLRLSGRIERIRGLLAGHFKDCGDMSAINRLLVERVSDLSRF